MTASRTAQAVRTLLEVRRLALGQGKRRHLNKLNWALSVQTLFSALVLPDGRAEARECRHVRRPGREREDVTRRRGRVCDAPTGDSECVTVAAQDGCCERDEGARVEWKGHLAAAECRDGGVPNNSATKVFQTVNKFQKFLHHGYVENFSRLHLRGRFSSFVHNSCFR